MPDLGLEVLFKGINALRLLQGLWVALRISLISVVISMPLGIFLVLEKSVLLLRILFTL